MFPGGADYPSELVSILLENIFLNAGFFSFFGGWEVQSGRVELVRFTRLA